MDFYEALDARRSIRKYEQRWIDNDVLHRIFEAARRAPSWANSQAVRWVVVRDAKIQMQLAAALSPGNPSTNAVLNAPVVLGLFFVRGKSGFYKGQATTSLGDWGLFDAGLAAANLTLAAAAEGLGTVHVGAFDHEQAAAVLQAPITAQLVELIPLGYPAHDSVVTARLEMNKVFFENLYRGDL
jgi:nitroreductase